MEELGKNMQLACQGLPARSISAEEPRLVNGFEVMPAGGRTVTPEFIRQLLEETGER